MEKRPILWAKENLLNTNIKYGAIGILVGVIMDICVIAFGGNGISTKSAIFNVLFSFFITLSITNIVALTQRYFKHFTSFWKFIIVFYACNVVGMVLGIELSYLIVSLIFNIKLNPFNHMEDYKTSIVIVGIVGTLILLYQLQKFNTAIVLKAKENDLAKLNQLKTQAELQALQSKINPHFLYNALNSIVSLIHEDANKAEDMTMKLSKLFRYSLNTQQENFCTVKEELDILNTYLDIEKVRFGNRINFKITAPATLQHYLIPRFLLQPLVENALKHGLKNTQENGKLAVTIQEENQQLHISVFDNGIDFPVELNAGYGMQSTFDKLKLLYTDYDLQLINSPEKHIKISIPIKV